MFTIIQSIQIYRVEFVYNHIITEDLHVLDPGSCASIQIYGVAFGITASTIMFRSAF